MGQATDLCEEQTQNRLLPLSIVMVKSHIHSKVSTWTSVKSVLIWNDIGSNVSPDTLKYA